MATAFKINSASFKMHPTEPVLKASDIDSPVRRSGFYTITPEISFEILSSRNSINRSMKVVKVEQLVADILANNFVVNGESIIFSDSGQLLDGQHRLTACAQAGMPIISNVAFGIKAGARETLDQGKSRSAGDILGMEDCPYSNVVAAIARNYFGYTRGDRTNLTRTTNISTAQILEVVRSYPHIIEIAKWAGHHANNVRGFASASILGIARAILEPVYGDEAVFFLDRVALGDNIGSDDPAYAVRKRLSTHGRRPTFPFAIECIMRGAIAHVEGRKLSRIVIDGKLPALPIAD